MTQTLRPLTRRWLTTIAAGLVAAACTPSVARAENSDAAGNWTQYHRDHRGWRYSPLDQVNASNVKRLRVAWIHQPGDITQGMQSTPLAVDGVIYYIGPNNRVFAVDGASGKELWRYITELDPVASQTIFSGYSRGLALGHGKVYLATTDGRAIALDRRTGKELWATPLTDPKQCHGCNFTSPPTVAGDVLIIGPTGGDIAQRGQIYAVNALTGAKLWQFDTIRDDPASWPGDSGKTGGGGAWMPGQYDPKLDLFFIGTSNAAPDFDGSKRRGDNLYTATTLALEPKTGKLRWHHQEIPHDVWDYDSAYEYLMLDRGGRQKMVHLNKGGFVTVFDRASGAVDNVWQFAENVNWVQRVDPKTGALEGRDEPQIGVSKLFCPSALGARSWNHGAYSPKTGLWYSNAQEFCNRITVAKDFDAGKLAFSQPNFGISEIAFEPPPGAKPSARLQAVDPFTGKRVWSVDYPLPGLGSVLVTAGDLVFNGDPYGDVHAYAAATGKELWRFNTGSGIRAGIISYAAGGKQYLLVPTGFGSLFPGFAAGLFPEFKQLNGGAAILAFTLE
ncbi:MAG TPA: PQQ-binding-like beta-propeller repeat protein [Methylibium sp.]|nr:PQQ-binding-like beta-propeller repeat protein [Methylibium sp.]